MKSLFSLGKLRGYLILGVISTVLMGTTLAEERDPREELNKAIQTYFEVQSWLKKNAVRATKIPTWYLNGHASGLFSSASIEGRGSSLTRPKMFFL